MASNVVGILCVVVALLTVASSVLGFIAHNTKLTPDEIQFDESAGVCVYPAKPAHALGICALPLLVAAMVISTVCFGCVKPPQQAEGGGGGASWSRVFKAAAFCVLSWIAAVLALATYVKGVKWNAATTRDTAPMGLHGYGCHYLKGDGFRRAAVITLVAGALGIRSVTMILAPAPAPAAEDEPKQDGEQPASAAAPPPPQAQGQAHAQV